MSCLLYTSKSGMRYRDIAVITGDMTLYGRLLKERFEDAGIPFFMDYNRSILSNSFIDMVLSLMTVSYTHLDVYKRQHYDI